MSMEQYITTFDIGGTSFTFRLASPEQAPVPALVMPFLAWLRERELLQPLKTAAEEALSRHMRTRLHSPFDKVMTDVLALAAGTRTNLEISTLFRPCISLAQAADQPSGFPDHSGMSRFHACLDERASETFQLIGQQALASHSLLREGDGPIVVDLDGTGFLTTTEGSRRGYFGPRAQGKKGLQWHLATASPLGVFPTIRERLVGFLDQGNLPTKCRFYDLFWEVMDVLDQMGLIDGTDEQGRPVVRRPLLWRFDSGITCGEFMEFLIEMAQHVITRGHDGRTAPRIIRDTKHLRWHWVSPNQEAADAGRRKIRNCHYRVRMILLRNHQPKGDVKYGHLLTTFPADAVPIEELLLLAPDRTEAADQEGHEDEDPGYTALEAVGLATMTNGYNARQIIEAAMKEEKRALHRDHQRTHSFKANQALAQLGLLVANLLTWFKHDLLGNTALEGLGLYRFIRDAMKLPARMSKHERQDAVQASTQEGGDNASSIQGAQTIKGSLEGMAGPVHYEFTLILPNPPAIRLIMALMARRQATARQPPVYAA